MTTRAIESVCVFCGSSVGGNPVYRETATAVGQALARRKLRLIYGGGNIGLMGVVADAALQAGAEVVGVIPRMLAGKEVAHAGLTELILVQSMHERKALMADRADAFLALPGGFGTFEELCEVLTWGQLGLHSKPCGLLNTNGFYDSLLALFDTAVAEGFLQPQHRSLIQAGADVEELFDRLASYVPEYHQKWIAKGQT